MTLRTASYPFEADELIALARLDIEKSDYENALAKLKAVLSAEQPPAAAFSMVARLYGQLKLFAKAREYYQRYLELHPNAELERFQLGMTHFDLNEHEKALAVWDQVIEQSPNHPPALFYKGMLQMRSGNIAAAKSTLESVLHAVPTDNLYFGQAKELLSAIEREQQQGDPAASDSIKPFAVDAYKIEH